MLNLLKEMGMLGYKSGDIPIDAHHKTGALTTNVIVDKVNY